MLTRLRDQTISWSGGLIDWSASSYTLIGYYAAYIRWIAVSCYDDTFLSYTAVATNSTTAKRANDVQSYVWGSE